MFDQLLEEAVAEGEVIAMVVAEGTSDHQGDPALAAGVMLARELFVDPENVQRLVTRMDTIRSASWW
jgi:hypothetical protein